MPEQQSDKAFEDYINEAIGKWLSEHNNNGQGISAFVGNFVIGFEIINSDGVARVNFGATSGMSITAASGLAVYVSARVDYLMAEMVEQHVAQVRGEDD